APQCAARQLVADGVEVDVDGGGVAPPGPLLGGGVEDDLDVAVRERLGPDPRPQRLVDLLDHLPRPPPRPSPASIAPDAAPGHAAAGRPEGQRASPVRAAWARCWAHGRVRNRVPPWRSPS